MKNGVKFEIPLLVVNRVKSGKNRPKFSFNAQSRYQKEFHQELSESGLFSK
jgi:hypothetical protein